MLNDAKDFYEMNCDIADDLLDTFTKRTPWESLSDEERQRWAQLLYETEAKDAEQ